MDGSFWDEIRRKGPSREEHYFNWFDVECEILLPHQEGPESALEPSYLPTCGCQGTSAYDDLVYSKRRTLKI